MKKQSLIEWFEEIAEKSGSVAEVGPEYYTAYLELTDREMRKLIGLIIRCSAKEINRMVFDENRRYRDEDIFKLIKNTLHIMFHGLMRISQDGVLCCYKRQGPDPTPEVEQLFEEKVARSEPLIRRALIEVLNRQNSSGRET